jgi:hypothetical protein
VAVNSIYASIIPSYKYNLVLKSFSYGTQVMGHPVQGVIESCTDILTTSYWLYVELGKIFKKFCQKIKGHLFFELQYF